MTDVSETLAELSRLGEERGEVERVSLRLSDRIALLAYRAKCERVTLEEIGRALGVSKQRAGVLVKRGASLGEKEE